jgi:hypothetical protein
LTVALLIGKLLRRPEALVPYRIESR